MGRRLTILVGLALAVIGQDVPGVMAQAPPASAMEDLPAPAEPSAAAEPAGVPPEQAPAGSLPPADRMPVPTFEPTPPAEAPAPAGAVPGGAAPRDLDLERSQGGRASNRGGLPDQNPLPPAAEPTGQAGAAPADGKGVDAEPFVLPADRLPLGKQSIGLTIDVQAPQVLNLNQSATLKIVVRNTGISDAMGVVVRDQLPESLSLLGSVPEAEKSDALLFWRLNTVPAGAERTIVLKVKAVKAAPFDHAATVTMLAGGKSRTMVREPKLKVEQVASTGNVLK